jgi:xylan 1,4-beta-xylosidase
MPTYTNPVLAGMHPDPSVCRHGDDYYLVCSSFEYWPALPLFHSRDLVHWRPIGHALSRPEQARIDVSLPSGDNGAYAATIRFHHGWFYISGTLVRTAPQAGNFIVKTQDPAGVWSDPVWLPHVEGIDPALFFDEGRLYIVASRHRPRAGVDWACEVTLQEIDAHSFAPLSAPTVLTRGVVQDATAAEAPRLLRRGAHVYLLIAEGGTAQNHAVTVLRAKDVRGPYEVAPHNPILTHRHRGPTAAVQAVGHADWVQTQQGDWWMLALATRPLHNEAGGVHDLLGRETFLLPMTWHNDWPVCCPGQGHVPLAGPAPALPWQAQAPELATAFAEPLDLHWRWLRTPHQVWWQVKEGRLGVRPLAAKLGDAEPVGMLLRAHQHHRALACVTLDVAPAAGQHAGLVVFYNDHHHLQWLRGDEGLSMWRCAKGQLTLVLHVPCGSECVHLRVHVQGLHAVFGYRTAHAWQDMPPQDIAHFCAAHAGGFVGLHVGLYATGEGPALDWFSDFRYQASA